MNDNEFIELLNLYVDQEISPEDAVRLESEVVSNPQRRKIHDQYCRIQKACSMLSDQPLEVASAESDRTHAFPMFRWPSFPLMATLAAAACLVAVLALRNRTSMTALHDAPAIAADAAPSRSVADTVDVASASDAMKPVFFTRLPASQAGLPIQRPMFTVDESAPQMPQLGWIDQIHMTPIFTTANSDFMLDPRPDLKTTVTSESQNSRDLQEAVEMTAFRFQR
jgi:hypothetical protein